MRARSSQEARNGDEGEGGWWESSQRVEELGTEDELASGGRRFASDPLRFTGMNLGNREDSGVRARKPLTLSYRESGDESTEDDDSERDSDDGDEVPPLDPVEEALADAAMARIARAHAKGKGDVKLSKKELAAYQRKMERVEYERQNPRRRARVAIPISHLAPTSRPKRLTGGDSPSDLPSPELDAVRKDSGYAAIDYPPMSSNSRRRSGGASTSSRRSSRTRADREHSPFTYSSVRHPSTARLPSDAADYQSMSRGPPSLRDSPVSGRADLSPASDPFQFMTGDKRASFIADAPYVPSSGDDSDGIRPEMIVRSSTGDSHEHYSTDSRPSPLEPARRVSRDKSPPPTSKKSSSSSAAPVRRKTTVFSSKSSSSTTTKKKSK